MPLPKPRVAFVAGCTGVCGNAIVEFLIRQPKEEWSRIFVSSRTPLKNYWQDPRVSFVAMDFLDPVENIIEKLPPSCAEITHAFFAAYVHADTLEGLKQANIPLFANFLTAIDTVAGESLQNVCLQTGGKHYGAHLGPVPVPLSEDMGRYEDNGTNFYYHQEDTMFRLQAQRNWSWNVIQPNAVIGFTPGKNGMSEALTMALYLLINKELGQTPAFPGNKYFYNSVDDNSFAGGLADLSVWASTHEHTKNESFIHVNGDVFVWRYFFKRLGEYFGLDIPPQEDWPEEGTKGYHSKHANSIKMSEWAKDKRPVWEAICEKYGGNKEAFDWGTWAFFDFATGKSWPTISTMTKARKFGWLRQDDTYETWADTFRSFENAGILPSQHLLLADRKPIDQQGSNGHVSNGHASNGHASNGHASNGHASNGHASNGHASNGHV
ncbi:hypothetical protein T440DRAFT_498198 [Plenodomus tracheiphilus IPT5]|uniref:PRISE-like Rossmann-fold domain-containing protein n=1 Tax=Plenodomus tracheiphilus IPT5 TaxID=1408161 RepID=A0A6A7BA86_9PLEO|nr:hypothetical protein T440DRAFT_498198 [Plenodomus tracheiphilus IPT5]